MIIVTPRPLNVSFAGINVGEEQCLPTTASGVFTGAGGHIPSKDNIPVGSAKFIAVNSGNACGVDLCYASSTAATGSGTLTYIIPIDYRDNNDTGPGQKKIFNETQTTTADANGKCTISKNGAGPYSANVTDPSSPDPFPADIVQAYENATNSP